MVACLLVILAAGAPGARAQDQPGGGSTSAVFAPYVSRLRIAMKDPLVKLTWQDPADPSGPIRIYRSTHEFAADTFADATLIGTAKPGVESFLDVPPHPGDYYYAVLMEKPGNGVYEVFVPFRNVTVKPVAVTKTATDQQLAATVSGVSATATDNAVTIRFEASRPERTLALYRSTSPILSTDALAGATQIQEISSGATAATDFPVPGIGYYYALVDTALLTSGSMSLVAGRNATDRPVEVPLGPRTIGIPTTTLPPRRTTPLPYLILQENIQNGSSLAPSLNVPASNVPLDQKSLDAVNKLVNGIHIASPRPLEPEVLAEDRVAADKGEEYTLKGIVGAQFSQRNWADTVKQLDNFLTLPLSQDVRARAQFYLGQAYYFQKMYKQAFLAFLLARNAYYTATRPWMDAILDARPAT